MPSTTRRLDSVKVVYRAESLQLVEFNDRGQRRRAWLPLDVSPTVNECRGGIPAGIVASTLAPVIQGEAEAIAERLVDALNRRGLFVAADAEQLPEPGRLVASALADAVKPLAALVLDIIRQEV